jgi:hypothetical protein
MAAMINLLPIDSTIYNSKNIRNIKNERSKKTRFNEHEAHTNKTSLALVANRMTVLGRVLGYQHFKKKIDRLSLHTPSDFDLKISHAFYKFQYTC